MYMYMLCRADLGMTPRSINDDFCILLPIMAFFIFLQIMAQHGVYIHCTCTCTSIEFSLLLMFSDSALYIHVHVHVYVVYVLYMYIHYIMYRTS